MVPKKANKLVIDDDEDEEWDDLIEDEEEIDDIIDDEDDEEEDLEEDDDSETSPSLKKGSRKTGKAKPSKSKKGSPGSSRTKGSFFSHPATKWTGRVLITIVVVFLLFAPIQPFEDMREATGIDSLKNLMRPYRNFPEWVNVTMEVSHDVVVRNGQAERIEIQLASPFDIPLESSSREKVVQDVKSVMITPEPDGGTSDFNTERNFLTGWNLDNVNPGPYQFKAIYNLHLHTYEWNMDEEDSGNVSQIPREYKDKYLGDDWPRLSNGKVFDENRDGIPDYYRYNPGDENISRIALKLTDDKPTVLGKVKAIYDWIIENFNYTTEEQRKRDAEIYGTMPKWATGCLKDWYGDCDDQSLLMASLCRAVGIPAWLEIGYLYDQKSKEWGGHGWFNVIIPRTGGREPVIAPIDPVNSEFLFRDPFRITDWVDNGTYIKDDMGNNLYNLDDYYNYFSTRKPTVVDVDITTGFNSVNYEEHGNIKKYVDRKIEPGNLQGTEQGIPEIPALNPLLVIPITVLLIAIPARKLLIKRD